MKIRFISPSGFHLYGILLLGLFLVSCAGQPWARVEIPPPSPLELAAQRVRQNDSSIEKYFLLGEGGSILVRGELQVEMVDFNVVYDLGRAISLSDSSYRVRFLVWEKGMETDIIEAFLKSEDTLNFIQDTLDWRPGPGRAGILLGMDDDYFETWEEHFDFFEQFGARITFFLQGDYTPFSAAALSRGHDVGFHSINHPDLRRVSEDVFSMETYLGAESFRHQGIPISSYAFPFGFSEPWMYEILLEHFGILRGYGVTFRIYHEHEIRNNFINSRAIDNTVLGGDENYEYVINLMLRTLKFLDDDRILPLTTHDISNDHWAISRQRLEFLFQTAVDLQLNFYLYSDFNN